MTCDDIDIMHGIFKLFLCCIFPTSFIIAVLFIFVLASRRVWRYQRCNQNP